jgi:hypothetical protein
MVPLNPTDRVEQSPQRAGNDPHTLNVGVIKFIPLHRFAYLHLSGALPDSRDVHVFYTVLCSRHQGPQGIPDKARQDIVSRPRSLLRTG